MQACLAVQHEQACAATHTLCRVEGTLPASSGDSGNGQCGRGELEDSGESIQLSMEGKIQREDSYLLEGLEEKSLCCFCGSFPAMAGS